MAVLQVLPSVIIRTSALRITAFSLLNHPGHTRRYRRFTCTLASARARLAVEVVASLSFLPDLHRLPQRQLARRSMIQALTIQAGVLDLLLRLQDMRGTSFIFISHNLAVIGRVSHQIAVLENGTMREFGTRDAVLTAPEHPYTRRLLEASDTARGEQ